MMTTTLIFAELKPDPSFRGLYILLPMHDEKHVGLVELPATKTSKVWKYIYGVMDRFTITKLAVFHQGKCIDTLKRAQPDRKAKR